MYTNKFLLNRLKRYSQYTEEHSGVSFTYEFDSKGLHDLYCLQNLAKYGDGGKFKILLNVMYHVFDSLYVKNSEEKIKNIDYMMTHGSNKLSLPLKVNRERFVCIELILRKRYPRTAVLYYRRRKFHRSKKFNIQLKK